MNRKERRKAQAEQRKAPAQLSCDKCGSGDFVYNTEPLERGTMIICGGCEREFGTYGTILDSVVYSRRPGGSLDGYKRVEFSPRYASDTAPQ